MQSMDVPELAMRMSQAIDDAGLSMKEVAARMKVAKGSVSRWLSGERAPGGTNLAKFAAVVGISVEDLTGEKADPSGRNLAEFLLAFADQLMVGRNAPAAADRAAGRRIPFTDEERTRLARQSSVMREGLSQKAGLDWDLLNEDQKRQILHQIEAMVASHPRR